MHDPSAYAYAVDSIRPVPAVAAALRTPASDPVVIAYSGGADSTLALLWASKHLAARRLIAAHYHHAVRVGDADEDLAHCREFARELGIEFISARRPDGRPHDEAALRKDRDAWLRTSMKKLGAETLIQGHHADDVIETVLMRLARGSGTTGLAAPRPVSRRHGIAILRPLIELRKQEILARLHQSGITFRHDRTNDDPDVALRNRVRLHLVPRMEATFGPRFTQGVTRARTLLEEDDDALHDLTRHFVTRCTSPGTCAEALHEAPRAIRRRLLHQLATKPDLELSLDAAAVDLMLDKLETRTPFNRALTTGIFAAYDGSSFAFHKSPPPGLPRHAALIPVPGATFWPDGASLEARHVPAAVNERADENTVRVRPTPSSTHTLQASARKPGMRYRHLGAPGSKKVSDLLINRKIPQNLRDTLPVIMTGDDILWIPGLPPSENHRLSEGESRALRLTWTPPKPA